MEVITKVKLPDGNTYEVVGAGMLSITYADLVTKVNDGELVPGQQYRITDYVTTTAQADTQSAGHAFDVIVTADSTTALNHSARAVLHEGDTYFANSNLAAWELKYDIKNDTSKYAWADATNGKGVIYEMIDEFNNRCAYDFKNIQYKVYKVTATSLTEMTDIVNKYAVCANPDLNSKNYLTIDTTDYKWGYTFGLTSDRSLKMVAEGYSMCRNNFIGNRQSPLTLPKCVLNSTGNLIQNIKIIDSYNVVVLDRGDTSEIIKSNDIISTGLFSYNKLNAVQSCVICNSSNNYIRGALCALKNSYHNHIEYAPSYVIATFTTLIACRQNVIAADCYNNTFSNSNNNHLAQGCSNNTFTSSSNNHLAQGCSNNTFTSSSNNHLDYCKYTRFRYVSGWYDVVAHNTTFNVYLSIDDEDNNDDFDETSTSYFIGFYVSTSSDSAGDYPPPELTLNYRLCSKSTSNLWKGTLDRKVYFAEDDYFGKWITIEQGEFESGYLLSAEAEVVFCGGSAKTSLCQGSLI